jgi:hypothetical protein
MSKIKLPFGADLATQVISNLGEPSDNADAATKNYVDVNIFGLGSVYQPLDQQLTDLSTLTYNTNTGKVIAVNATEDGFELVAQGGGVSADLSDLSPTAINQDLIPDTTARNLGGSGANQVWNTLHVDGVVYFRDRTTGTMEGAISNGLALDIASVSKPISLSATGSAVLIGGVTRRHNTSKLEIQSSTAAEAALAVRSSSSGDSQNITFYTTSGDVASPTTTTTNKVLSQINTWAYNGTVFSASTSIKSIQTGAHGLLTTPTKLEFSVAGGDALTSVFDIGPNYIKTYKPVYQFAAKAATYSTSTTISTDDTVILASAASGNITLTLPIAGGYPGKIYMIKKTDATVNTVTIDGDGSETIDGALTKVISTQYDSMQIACDGVNWFII